MPIKATLDKLTDEQFKDLKESVEAEEARRALDIKPLDNIDWSPVISMCEEIKKAMIADPDMDDIDHEYTWEGLAAAVYGKDYYERIEKAQEAAK